MSPIRPLPSPVPLLTLCAVHHEPQARPNDDYTGAGDEADGTPHVTTESEFKDAIDEYIDMAKAYLTEKSGAAAAVAEDELEMQVTPPPPPSLAGTCRCTSA